MIIPPYLQPGDTVGLVAPAGFMPFEKMEACINTLQDWGYTIQMGATTHSHSVNYFSGTDEERCADLQAMLDDPVIKAILCVRGGYGIGRIIDRLDFKKFKKHPKWIVGFSDVTVLHSHLYSEYKIASLHAPMAAAFLEGEADNPYLASLRRALTGEPAEYTSGFDAFNQPGEGEGDLVGGNLTLLAHLIGTPSDIKTKNRILFLEDIGEYLYNLDRMLTQLKRSGKLDRLSGLVIGGFSNAKDTERPYGMSAYEIIHEQVKEYDYPILFGFPVSHERENLALKVGVPHRLVVTSEGGTLSEI